MNNYTVGVHLYMNVWDAVEIHVWVVDERMGCTSSMYPRNKIQYASKKTFRTVGNKRRLNGTVVLKKRSRDGVKRSTPRFQRVNGSTSHVARSAISTHAHSAAPVR